MKRVLSFLATLTVLCTSCGKEKETTPRAEQTSEGQRSQDLVTTANAPLPSLTTFNYIRYLNTEYGTDRSEPGLRAMRQKGGRSGIPDASTIRDYRTRPISEKATIFTEEGEGMKVNRSYFYAANGYVRIADKSTTFHSDPKATTYRNDLTETLDFLGRTTSVKGTITDSSGGTTVVDRTYTRDADGGGTVTDKSKTTHENPTTITYVLDLIEKDDLLGRCTSVRGTITSSDGRKIKVNRQYQDNLERRW